MPTRTDTQRVEIVDLEGLPEPGEVYIAMATFEGIDAIERGYEYLATLPDADAARGRYSFDVSDFCNECCDYHSFEADCDD